MFKNNAIAISIALTVFSAPVVAEIIKIKRATYRADVTYFCDATSKIKEICKDQETCTVSADNNLCGDPKFGMSKKLIVEYSCGKTGKSVRADEGTNATLSCE